MAITFATKCIAPNFEHNRSSKEEKDNKNRIIEATYSDPYFILLLLLLLLLFIIICREILFLYIGWIILFACPTRESIRV